jgi:hypothetical protein
MSSIFVSVVSYRDPLLSLTVNNLLDQKSDKNEVTVGILEQTRYEDSLEVKDPNFIRRKEVRYKRIDPQYTEGVGWARHINSLQLRDEEFFYQIDSHMLFDKDWDCSLISDWQLGRKKHDSDRVIISGSCKGFDLDKDGRIINAHDMPITSVIKCFDYEKFGDFIGVHGDIIEATEDVQPAIHTCAGNFFTTSRWASEVGPDPKMYFLGEEHKMVLMSFFAGYAMFHPTKTICYHFNGTGSYITKPWVKPLLITEEQYSDFCNRSREHWLRYLHGIDKEKLMQFYEYSGINYVDQYFDERVRTYSIKGLPPEERKPGKSPWYDE